MPKMMAGKIQKQNAHLEKCMLGLFISHLEIEVLHSFSDHHITKYWYFGPGSEPRGICNKLLFKINAESARYWNGLMNLWPFRDAFDKRHYVE
jgi:hypothetical protein